MSKLKNYEIDAITSKVLAMIKEENKKNQPVFKETEERKKLKDKVDKLKEEEKALYAKIYKIDSEVKIKYNNPDIHFNGTEYTVYDTGWKNREQVRQEIILSQIKSDNLDEMITKIVKEFTR